MMIDSIKFIVSACAVGYILAICIVGDAINPFLQLRQLIEG